LPVAGRWLFDGQPDQSNVKERFLARCGSRNARQTTNNELDYSLKTTHSSGQIHFASSNRSSLTKEKAIKPHDRLVLVG
jgi:hypothetical protein